MAEQAWCVPLPTDRTSSVRRRDQRTCMAEELARWIVESGQRATDRAALQAIALFAGESATMRLAPDLR